MNRVGGGRGGTIVCRSREGCNVIVVVYLVVLAAGFFFLVVRPQRRQMAARRALIASVGVGDEVVTTGGIHGTVRTLGDGTGFGQLRSGGFQDDEPEHDLPDEPDEGRPDAAGGAG